jgi:proline racemase
MRDAGGVMLRTVSTTDYHTAGEPFRIVAEPPVALPGVSVADRRVRAIDSPDAQGLRKLLCFEPRGHADMYGGLVVPPDDEGAHLGVLFWHKDGFSTACGHGTIALGTWAVDTGLVQAPGDGSTDVVIDVPSGRVTARVHRDRRVPDRLVLSAAVRRLRKARTVNGQFWRPRPWAASGVDTPQSE